MAISSPSTDGGGPSLLNPLFSAEMMGIPEDWLISPFLSEPEGKRRSRR